MLFLKFQNLNYVLVLVQKVLKSKIYVLIIVCTQNVVIRSYLITFWVSPMPQLSRIQSKPVNFNFFEENELQNFYSIQCDSFSNILPLRFYVKSIYLILKPQNTAILTILAAKNFWVFGNFLHFHEEILKNQNSTHPKLLTW